ncbi:MAG: Tim44 domain-containing protein, partial [Azonexus sp.]
MKSFALFTAALALGLTLATGDAEAKRLGGGSSAGMQRQSVAPSAPPSAAKQAPATAPAAAPAAQPKRSWMGPLAG